jgi:hypothetical protein
VNDKTRKALEMARQYFNENLTPGAGEARDAITEALAEPAPRRLTYDEIDDIWATTAHSNRVFALAIEARIFGDK